MRGDDREWAATRGDFEDLATRLGPLAYRFLIGRLGSEEEAEEAVQETFMLALRGLPSLRDPALARSWFFAIAANVARQRRRRFVRRDAATARLERGAPTVEPPPEERVLRAEEVRLALAGLSEDDQEVLLLFGLCGLGGAEVGAVLGIGPDAARKRWQRACARFREAFTGGTKAVAGV